MIMLKFSPRTPFGAAMEALRPFADLAVTATSSAPASTREDFIRLGLGELVAASGALASGGATRLADARGTLATLGDQATAIAGLVRGLGPEFTQGDWAPLVERVHDATTRGLGDVQSFLGDARQHGASPRLLDSVLRTAASLKLLREEATLLAGRGSWSV